MVASVTTNGAPVCKIDKMEGGFSKALLLSTEDGVEVIAKISCLNAGRALYSMASEAAVLQCEVYSDPTSYSQLKFSDPVSSHTTINIPKIFAWSADPSDSVGARWIIWRKLPAFSFSKSETIS